MSFTTIPRDIHKIIFGFLEYADLKKLLYVNKNLYKYVKEFNPKPFRKNEVYSLLDVVSIVDASTKEIIVCDMNNSNMYIYKGHDIFLEKIKNINGRQYFVTECLWVLVNEKSIKKAKSCFVEMRTRTNDLVVKVDVSCGSHGFEVGDNVYLKERNQKGKIVGVTMDDKKLWMKLDEDDGISFLYFKDIDEILNFFDI
jgi:hypothetical protein